MLGIAPYCNEYAGIDKIGQACRIAPSVTIVREPQSNPQHGIFLGDNVSLYDHTRLVLGDPSQHPDTNIVFGNNIIVNTFCYLSGEGGLSIADDVLIGSHVKILSAGHMIDGGDLSIWHNPLTYGQIRIERGAWIAAGVTILQGITIGAGAVIGADSVVTRDVPDAAIVAGNPARLIRYRTGFEPKTSRWRKWLRP